MMHTVAIDCGASFIKGALIRDGRILTRMERSSPAVHGDGNFLEARQIRELVPLVRQMVLALVGGGISEIKLCLSNEMHGFLLAFEDGTPFTDYISWQKEFGSIPGMDGVSPMKMLAGTEYGEDILHTGMPLRAGLPSCNLLYLSMTGILKETDRELRFYTLGDYILRVLLGREPVCHPSNAAATGLYDLETGDWNRRLAVTACGTGKVRFPKVGTDGVDGSIGKLRVHALPALGDQQAALLGSGLERGCTVSFNLGTGAQVSRLTRNAEYSEKWQIRPYFNGYFLKTIPHLPCGRALNVYVRFFQEVLSGFSAETDSERMWAGLLEMERKASGGSLQCDLSFFENAVTGNTVGSITNMGEYSFTPGNLMRAVFTQMARNFIWAADRIETDEGRIREILFSGGVARKIPMIREQILSHYEAYGNVDVKVSQDETLLGLYVYGNP